MTELKTFDNPKDLLKYLETKAKEGEEVCLDERPTFTHPKRKSYFKKMKNKKIPNMKVENMVLGIKIPAIRRLTFEEINTLITKSSIGFWEILREETSTPMLKLKTEINGNPVCSLLWINSNKIQFMGVKRKQDARDCYREIIEELNKIAKGMIAQ